MYMDCIHSQRLTGSLVLRILVCCLAAVCFRSLRPGLTVLKLSPVSSCRPVHSARIPQRISSRLCMVTVYITYGMMAFGDALGSQPKDDRSGVNFRDELQTLWNGRAET